MIILRNKLFTMVEIPGKGSYSFNMKQIGTISAQTGMSRAETIKTMRTDPTVAEKYMNVGTPYKGKVVRGGQLPSQSQTVGVRTGQWTEGQLKDATTMAKRNATLNKGIPLESVGTANYTQSAAVHSPDVYRNNAFTKPKNTRQLKRFKEVVRLGMKK